MGYSAHFNVLKSSKQVYFRVQYIFLVLKPLMITEGERKMLFLLGTAHWQHVLRATSHCFSPQSWQLPGCLQNIVVFMSVLDEISGKGSGVCKSNLDVIHWHPLPAFYVC